MKKIKDKKKKKNAEKGQSEGKEHSFGGW